LLRSKSHTHIHIKLNRLDLVVNSPGIRGLRHSLSCKNFISPFAVFFFEKVNTYMRVVKCPRVGGFYKSDLADQIAVKLLSDRKRWTPLTSTLEVEVEVSSTSCVPAHACGLYDPLATTFQTVSCNMLDRDRSLNTPSN